MPTVPIKRDADGLTRAQRIDLGLDLLLRERCILGDPEHECSRAEVAQACGVSVERVRQWEAEIIAKLQRVGARRRRMAA